MTVRRLEHPSDPSGAGAPAESFKIGPSLIIARESKRDLYIPWIELKRLSDRRKLTPSFFAPVERLSQLPRVPPKSRIASDLEVL